MSMDFETEIIKAANLIAPADYELAPETIPIAVEVIEGIDQRYGPDSTNPKPYHNASHSLAVPRRAVSLTNLLYPFIPERYRTDIYDLGILSGAGHDEEQGLTRPGQNERLSADRTAAWVSRVGGQLDNERFKQRLGRGILATVIQFEDGKLTQPNLAQGEPDPIEFIMAFADRNGIAMGGPLQMVKDATNLYYEQAGEEATIDGLYDFLKGEVGFLKYGLNDWYMKPLIKYYFGDNDEEVYDEMSQAYNLKIRAAHKLAEKIAENPEIKPLMHLAAKGLEVADSSRIGRNLGKTLIRKLAS